MLPTLTFTMKKNSVKIALKIEHEFFFEVDPKYAQSLQKSGKSLGRKFCGFCDSFIVF